MLTKYTTVNIVYDAGVDRVLMIRKRRNANGFGANGHLWKDKYNFPGGKLEKGETFTEGAVRETIEEMQRQVKEIVKNTTGVDVIKVNIKVKNIYD